MVSLDSLKGSKLPSTYSADDSDENITNQARTKNKKGKTIYLSNHFNKKLNERERERERKREVMPMM